MAWVLTGNVAVFFCRSTSSFFKTSELSAIVGPTILSSNLMYEGFGLPGVWVEVMRQAGLSFTLACDHFNKSVHVKHILFILNYVDFVL